VPLRCDANVLIDRWDVRASMDIIPKYKSDPASLPEMDFSEQQCNYERYRVLVQNQCRKVDEEAYLQRIDLEELYPKKSIATRKAEKKKLAAQKAAIGYKYEENTVP
ncbi:CLK4-associating serine/arginine rich protein-like, partial [Sycon ciliatum]|uniref:CLK4-associating serine/arginine rich protein-like n=1 Tax=Sycon ciliatum TaxID=27933 RepID=UPI0031F6F134